MAATGALLSAALAVNFYLRAAGRAKASFFVAAVIFNTALLGGYLAAPHVLHEINQYRDYRVFYVVLYSAVTGFFGVPVLLQLLLFIRESYLGARLSDAFWASHRKLILGSVGTNLSWAVFSGVAGLAVIVTRLLIEWILRSVV